MKTYNEIDIKYYDNDGNIQVRCSVPVTQDALVHYELMQSHYCKLSFKLSKPIYFLLGDFIDTPYGRFELIDLTKAKDNDTIGYSYEIQFDAYYRKFKNKILKYRPNTGSQEATFSLTSKISTHVEVIMKSLAYYAKLDKSYLYDPKFEGEGTDYTYVIDASVDANAAKLITYSNTSMLDAIANIAQTFECEWWFEGNILHFGTCENTNAIVDFRLNDNIVSMSSSQSQSTYANRVYAFGAARNLPSGYKNDADADITKDGVVEKRLMLPTSAECSDKNKQLLAENGFELKNGYIQVSGLREDQYVEGVTTNDDIYPRNLIKTSKVTSYEKDVEDESTPEEGDFIKRTFYRVNSLSIINEDGEKTGDMAFRKSYILSGKNLHIVFQSGSLNGMDFECEFNPDGVEEILKDDDGNPMLKDGKEQINPMSQVFEIVANEDYGRFLPDITLHPKDGDTFVLYNWDSTKLGDTLVSSASNELLTDAIKDLKKSMIDPTTYTCTAEANYSYNQGRGNLHGVGDRVNLYNKGYGDSYRASRIIGYEFCLDIPYDGAKYYVGEKPSYSRLNAMESKIEELVYNGQSYLNTGGGSGGNSIYIIKSYDKTSPTEYNVYSARAVYKSFLSKLSDDTAEGMITFAKGLVSKGLADLMMGAKFGNNAMITQLGEAVLSAIKSLDYDNAAEQGFSVEKEKNGKYHAFVTNLTIWGKAIFHELEVRKLSYSGGNIYLSGAGSKLIKVVPVKKLVSDGGVTSWVETTEDDVECVGWKCYLLADNGTTATMNYWQEGDQVRCQTIGEIAAGGAYSDVSNKSYWRTIPDGGVSTQNEKIYGTTTETYLDEVGKEQTREVQVELYGGQSFAWIVVGKHSADFDGYTEDGAPAETKDIPAEGDTIVLDGNRHRNKGQEYDKTDRQNVIILETTGEYAPRIACYANISEYKHTFVKSVNGENKEVSLSVFETSPKGGTKINSSHFEWISDDGSTINIINYRGDWVSGNKYHKNDQVNHNNAVWVCVANSGVDVSEEPSDGSSNWKKVLYGGKGEKGDDAVSYSVQFSIVNDTVNGVTSQRLYVTFTKSVGSNITSGTIGKIGFNGRAKVYLDGEENRVMSSELSRDYPYIDIGDKGHADTIKGKKNLSVELIDANGKIVASNTFFFAEKGDKGDKGENAIRLALTNENSSVSCDKNGNPIGTVQGTIAILYDGAVAANADRVTYSIVSHDGLSVKPEINAGGAIDNIEIRGGNTSLKASINIKAVYENQAYYATYTITKVLAGSDGTPAIIYWIEPSATAIKVDSDGNANPSTITCKQYKQVGAESPVAGDKKIYYRHNAMDSTLWNEYTEAINPATNVDAYEFVLADKTPSNSSAIIYDRESIPVIKDGQNGNDGLSGNGIVPAYIRSKDNPTPPTSTDKNNLDNGWSLAIPSVADVKNVSYSDSSWTDYSDDSYTWKKSPTTAANSTSWCLVTFTTTQANQTVMFVIKSFSEKKYDYIFLSEIDASNVPSKPGFAGASRAVSGNGVELSITDVVATAGTHTVYICYGKDASGDSNGDYGLFRIESMAGIPLWQSNGKEVFTREDNGTIKSKIESWSEPFKVTGENGEDAVSYTVTLTRGSNGITQGLYVGVTRYIGTACTTGTIIDFGMSCKAYTDGTLAEGLTDRLQTSDNYIDFAAFPKAKSFTVELFDKNGNKVATGNYSSGDDAISILVEDAPLVFDTDDSGTVPASVTKTAKVKVMKGNTNVANDCTQLSSRDDLSSNCMCNVGKDEDNGCISVSVQGNWISKNDVIVDGVNQGKVSATSGYAVAQFVYAGVVYFAQVPFSVNVAKFTGSVVANNKKFETKFTEISTRFENTPTNKDLTDAESRITQTAREISLSVSEKSIARRNLLIGSAFVREDNNCIISNDARIEMNTGYQGTNCIRISDDTTDGITRYPGAFWDGSQGGKSVRITKGKKYVISCWYKTNNANGHLSLEALYTDKQTNAERKGPPKYLSAGSLVPKPNQWQLFTTVIDTTDAEYDYIAFNFYEYCDVESGLIEAYICRPMVEEGDTYGGWTLSQNDYDIIGANLIDNSRTLDVGGNVLEVKGQKALVGDAYELTYIGSDDYNTFYKIKGSTFKLGVDYTISFEVRGDAKYMGVYGYYPITNTKFTFYAEPQNGAMTEVTDVGKVDNYVALIQVKELSKQQRVWSHFRFKDRLPEQIYFQFPKNAQQTGVTSCSVTITKPKIEVGAVVTEYTERKSDLVDKASLKAAGIVVDSESVTLYGNQVHIKKNKTDTNDTVLIDNATGKVSAGLIDADKVVAKGIQAKNLEATNLNVTGNSRFGIWEIVKDDTFGEMIQARGDLTLPSGTTASGSGINYLPLYIRGGKADINYFRVGVSCTEFSYLYGNDFCGVWTGKAADYVCGGTDTVFNTPTGYDYNTSYHPAEYIYATKSSPNDPAFAINVIAKGFTGTPTAIQTNGAIRGVIAPNLRIMNYSGKISSSDCIVIVTKGGITLKMPAGPVVGQTLLIYSKVSSNVYIEYDSSGGNGTGKMYSDGSLQTKIRIGRAGTFTYFIFDGENWCYAYFNGSHDSA